MDITFIRRWISKRVELNIPLFLVFLFSKSVLSQAHRQRLERVTPALPSKNSQILLNLACAR